MTRVLHLTCCAQSPGYPENATRIPAHRLVLEPLLQAATEARVFQKRGLKFEVDLPPHTRARNQIALDLSRDVVRGSEMFWNASGWRRGAVCIRVDVNRVAWDELFSWTQYGGVWASRRQLLKSSPGSALAYAEREGVRESAVACFTASNGIHWLELWFDEERAEVMEQLARASCRSFVRWIEQGKFPREIIYDRGPYSEMV